MTLNRFLAIVLMTLAYPFLAVIVWVFCTLVLILVWPLIPFGRPVREGSKWTWKVGR